MPRPMSHLRRRLGRRGGILVLLGVVWVGIGVGVGYDTAIIDGAQGLFHLLIPTPLRIALWVVCGTIAVFAGIVRAPKWQGAGFAALVVPVTQRALSYLGGMFMEVYNGRGTYQTWPLFLIFIAVTGVILIVAGWREENDHTPRKRPRRGIEYRGLG